MSSSLAAIAFRFAVNVMPKPGILDPQGRAVRSSLGHLAIDGVSAVRVGRRVELTVTAADEVAARAVVARFASELLANPLIEVHEIELLAATPVAATPDRVTAEVPTG
ncbi:MAG TPA: phosphoribosylformylglycinamidine synthase subunit PurS [Candidatus Limnocylindrales bacterium]